MYRRRCWLLKGNEVACSNLTMRFNLLLLVRNREKDNLSLYNSRFQWNLSQSCNSSLPTDSSSIFWSFPIFLKYQRCIHVSKSQVPKDHSRWGPSYLWLVNIDSSEHWSPIVKFSNLDRRKILVVSVERFKSLRDDRKGSGTSSKKYSLGRCYYCLAPQSWFLWIRW